MKTIKKLLFVAIITLTVMSCKNDTKKNVENNSETTVKETTNAPNFDSAALQEYVDAYDKYMASYAEAAESKDMSKMGDLATKGQELATMSQNVMKNLKGDDIQKFTDYMTEKSKEMQALVQKMTAQ